MICAVKVSPMGDKECMIFGVSELHTQTLARAAMIVGGIPKLAEHLGLTPQMLSVLVRGDAPVPPELFLRASEIVTDAGVVDAAKLSEPD